MKKIKRFAALLLSLTLLLSLFPSAVLAEGVSREVNWVPVDFNNVSKRISGCSSVAWWSVDYLINGASKEYNDGWHTADGVTDAYVTIDLNETYLADSMTLWPRPSQGNDHPQDYYSNRFVKDYEIYVSDKSPDYSKANPVEGITAAAVGTIDASQLHNVDPVTISFEGTEGRYVTLHVLSIQVPGPDAESNVINISELSLGLKGRQGYENLAKGATATASSQYSASFGPMLAVDQNAGTRWATPNKTDAAWLEIDFAGEDEKTFNTVTCDLFGNDFASAEQRVQRFRLEKWENGEWVPFYWGTSLSEHAVLTFCEPVTTAKLRLNFLQCTEVTIFEVGVYEDPDYVQPADHTFGAYDHDADSHWNVCTNCGLSAAETARTDHIWEKDSENSDDSKTAFVCVCGAAKKEKSDYLTLTVDKMTLQKGAVSLIPARVRPSDAEITWSSSDSAVADVAADGTVTAMDVGLATITAAITTASGTYAASCKVIVRETAAVGSETPLRLHYDEPATQWMTEALPIGNGYMGGMIFGGVEKETFQFNEKTLWVGNTGPDYKGTEYNALQQIQQQLAGGKWASYMDTNILGPLVTGVSSFGAYQNFGSLELTFGSGSGYTDYERYLDLRTAVAGVRYTMDGVQYAREYFANYPDRVMVMKLSASESGKISFTAAVTGAHADSDRISAAADGTILLTGKLQINGLQYASQFKLIPEGGAMTANSDGTITVSGADSVVILLSAATDYINDYPVYMTGEDPLPDVQARVDDAAKLGYETLLARHLADYEALFSRVELDLGETDTTTATDELLKNYQNGTEAQKRQLEVLLFQYGRYLLIESSRDGSLPANLQGVWNNSNNPEWLSDYHTNVNLEMNYWPAYTTNIAETALPLLDYVDGMRAPGRNTAKAIFGIETTDENDPQGWVVNTMNNPFGYTGVVDNRAGWAPASNAWLSQSVWDYYSFTMDETLLREQIYPIIREAAVFWTQALVEDGPWLLSSPSFSPEQGPVTAGCAYDQQLIWQLYTDVIKASEVLGVDEELRATLTEQRARLDPLQITKRGTIAEWRCEDDFLEAAANGAYTQNLALEQNHRHTSQLVGLFSGNLFTSAFGVSEKEMDAYINAAIKTLNERGDSGTGWSRAMKIAMWARLCDGDRAYQVLQSQLTRVTQQGTVYAAGGGGTYDNLLCAHPPFQIDGSEGATAAIAEMLLQSHDGAICPLPALPEAWASGSYTGLVARGDFEVDAQWDNQALTALTIYSGSGNVCTISYPGIGSASVVYGGTPVSVTRVDADTIRFDTEAGCRYTISSISAQHRLDDLIAEAEEILDGSFAQYSETSWSALEAACAQAKAPTGTVREAIAMLSAAIDGLEDLSGYPAFYAAKPSVIGSTSSAYTNEGYTLASAVNGVISGGDGWHTVPGTTDAYLTIDLGSAKAVTELMIAARTGYEGRMPRNCDVYVTETAPVYSNGQISGLTEDAKIAAISLSNGGYNDVQQLPVTNGRYVTVHVKDFMGNPYLSDCINVSEIAVKTMDAIDVSGHTHADGTATCHAAAICAVCGVSYGGLNKNNHAGETETRGYVRETYETEGYTGDVYCLNCGEKVADGTIIPKLEDAGEIPDAVSAVEALIEAIDTADKATIEAARSAYDALTDEQKAQVTNLAKLEAAERYWNTLNTEVSLRLTGAEESNAFDESVTYTLSGQNMNNLATMHLVFDIPVEYLSEPAAEAADGWYIVMQTWEAGKLTVIICNNDGVNGEGDILTITAKPTETVGEATVSVTFAELGAYLGDRETFVHANLTAATITTTLKHNIFDVNKDGTVDLRDVTRAQRWYGTNNPDTDVNRDGEVDIDDMIMILNNFSDLFK